MTKPKEKTLDAIEDVWLGTKTHHTEPGFAEADQAHAAVHANQLDRALELARTAESKNHKWGLLRATIETHVLARQLRGISG